MLDRAERLPGRQRWIAPAAVVASIALFVGAAGVLVSVTRDDEGPEVATMPAGSSPPATTPSPSSTAPTNSTTADDRAALPGERHDIYPNEGARLAVVGVAAADVLNVRAGPGADYPISFTLEPLFDDAFATGHNRLISGRGYWSEIRVGDRVGWVSTAFVLQPGQADDVTHLLYPADAERPSGSLTHLATVVAARTVEGDEIKPKVVVVDGPRGGDPGEVVVDVVGVGDDSVGGFRMRIFAVPTGGGSYTLRTVEQIVMCRRGVTSDGLCV